MEYARTYKGFSLEDTVYYYQKGTSPSCPTVGIGAIIRIFTEGETAMFHIFGENEELMIIPYEHVFKNQKLCYAYATSLT